MQCYMGEIMLKEERQEYILNRISKDNRIYITVLSTELGISDDTLRRDLAELDKKGLLTKVHGGAIAKSGISIKFSERMNTATRIKQEMASKLVPLFKSGDILLMDAGTSNLEVARQISKDMSLTVYTNCFPIANELFNHPKIDLVFLGGKVFPSSQVTVGVSVYQMLRTIRPDWAIIGVSDIHPNEGLTTSDREEAIIKRTMIEQGIKRVVIADGHKLDTARNFHVASLREIDYIVTEDSKVDYIKQNWPRYSYEVL